MKALRNLAAILGVTAALVLVPAAGVAQEGAAGVPRETMWDIFEALRATFELSLDEAEYESGANRARILAGLERLATSTDSLDAHGREMHESYLYLGSSLASDAETALRRYRDGQYAGSRFMLHKLTENCFACHAKLPSARDYTFADQFIGAASAESMAPEELARLQVATRQFGAALTTYEAMLRSPDEAPAHLDYTGVLRDYLTVVIRVEVDPGRAADALAEFTGREDVPDYLSEQVGTWSGALRSVELEVPAGKELATARSLVEAGRSVNRYPLDRRGLVYFVSASSILERFLVERERTPSERAETYLLLGIAESHIAHSYWVSETEFFLESAIRADPASAHAEEAFRVLSDYLTLAYSGSAGVEMPPDAVSRLAELRELIESWR